MQASSRCYIGSLKTCDEKGEGKIEVSFIPVYLNSKIFDFAQSEESGWEVKRAWNDFSVIGV